MLFLVQPLMARMTLPSLGGSPSVWAVTMCFFQAMLLLGYCYAHALNRLFRPRVGLGIHLIAMVLATFSLPIELPESLIPRSAEVNSGLALIVLLGASIGLPFAVMSGNAPLLQRWFHNSGHPHAKEPYFLYAASNIGSMVALIAYPIVIEPFVGLKAQSELWASGFGVLAIAIAASGLFLFRAGDDGLQADARRDAEPRISWGKRAYWLLMSFVPSALLVAWTNHITTDIAAAPFLWLPPLALYLLSFVAVFGERPWIGEKTARAAQLAAFPISFFMVFGVAGFLIVPLTIAGAISFFATALICHRQLYLARPPASQLTEFYLIMSVGGVLGGAFVSLLAPQVFSHVAEYPLLLLIGIFAASDVLDDKRLAALLKRPLLPLAIFVAAGLVSSAAGYLHAEPGFAGSNALLIAFFATAAAVFMMADRKPLMALFVIVLILQIGAPQEVRHAQLRNFFGVLTVADSADGAWRLMYHGTTVHGAQRIEELAPGYGGKPQPATYYTPKGGTAFSVTATQERLKNSGRSGSIGVVGLGTGSLACYRQPGERWKFYEINPDVIAAARNSSLFTFLSSCAPGVPIVTGDARLTLQSEPRQSFDLLIMDAFSSDTVPVHLMTTEALSLYLSLLRDDGVLVLHISNRHMELASVLLANRRAIGHGLFSRVVRHRTGVRTFAESGSLVVAISRNDASLAAFDRLPGAGVLQPAPGVHAWTDDYANIAGAIWRMIVN
ncbi:MAG: fused MFS/spermidine synthase [Hyphomicrobiales bacterium]